jgi:hypothetical protein
MRILRHSSLVAALFSLLLGVLAARAGAQQSQQPDQGQQNQGQQNQGQTPQGQKNEEQATTPIPAYHSPLASQAGDDSDQDQTQPMTPDTRALSGAENLSVGSLENAHSYWQPHIDITGSVDSNPEEGPNSSNWGTWVSLSGGVDLHRTSGVSDLTLTYLGGGMISTGGNQEGNGVVQQLGVVQKLSLRRWTLSFIDQVSYLPGSAFGFAGLGGAGLPASGSTGLNATFGPPPETALTGLGQSIANAFTTEADVNLTPRTSLTFVGGYSLLHYSESGLLDSTDANFRGGYNYLLTRKDTIAFLYTYSGISYGNYNQSIDTHTVEGSFARRITGRLAFQVAAGPQIALFHTPIPSGSGSSGSGTASANASTELYWSLNTNLRYQWQRTALALSYNHGVSAGSGLLGGSVADFVSGSVTRQMSRTFSSGLTGGYSRNRGLAITSTTPTSQTFDYWFVGASFSHPIGRTLGLTFSYQLQYQDSSSSFCIGPTCGTSLVRHVISFGIGWHDKPLLF